jgi:hypothetical protein
MLTNYNKSNGDGDAVPTTAVDKVLEYDTVAYVKAQLDNARGSADALAKDINACSLLLNVTFVIVFVVVTILCFLLNFILCQYYGRWFLCCLLFLLLSKSVRYEKEQMFWVCEDVLHTQTLNSFRKTFIHMMWRGCNVRKRNVS